MKKITIILFIVNILAGFCFAQIFVASDGDDANPGLINEPVESIQRAQELASPGDTVYIRGGLYQVREDQISSYQRGELFACISYLNKSGNQGQTIKYWAYPGEQPVFDFSAVKPVNKRVAGIYIVGSYIHIKGLEMTGIQVTITTHTESYCIYSLGNHNIFEQINMHDNIGTGLRHYGGGNNLFLNCDSYRNHDNVSEDGLGVNSDGFGCHPDPGSTGNVFKGCRAWFNSDDGFDIIRSDEAVVFDSCWAFYNGFSTSFDSLGDGEGFKAGGYAYLAANSIPNPVPRNTIRFCIAVGNKVNGFFSAHHLGGNDWYNNSAYRNEINFNMVNRESPESDNLFMNGYDHMLKNNLGYKARGSETAYIDTSQNTLQNNYFELPITITDDDFVSLDEELLTASRKGDGSLPDIDFMRPAPGSDIIDAGVDIGFQFIGDAPDLGAIEYDYTYGLYDGVKNRPRLINLFQNYPNPFNPKTVIRYSLPVTCHIDLSIYNILGQKVATLVNKKQPAGTYNVEWDASGFASGVYLYKLETGNGYRQAKKLVLLK